MTKDPVACPEVGTVRLVITMVALASAGVALAAAGVAFAEGEKPLLLRNPSVSRTQVVFSYAGNLWIASREGGDASRLTTGGHERNPAFSPDGALVAFTGEYDGNQDVYVVPASGGVPRRITHHPGDDDVVGWTPDGTQVVFRSSRTAPAFGVVRLFTVPVAGGFPTEVPLPRAAEGSFSPDGSHLAYVPIAQWQKAWKRYRGGQTLPIWIANLADSAVETTIPRDNSNDFNPMWVADTVYFLSDRNGPVSLFAYDTRSKQVRQVVANDGLDIKSASAGPGAIVYEQFASLHLLELDSGRDRKLDVRVVGDISEVRPHFQKIEPKRIQSAAVSPTGARAVFAARGEIFTAPAEKGDLRNLTKTTSVVERDPAWSPDGKSIAYLSDESGEYALHIRDQSGLGDVRKIGLGSPPTFYYSPTWSAGLEEDRLHRQAAGLVVRRPREEDAPAHRHRHLRWALPDPESRVVRRTAAGWRTRSSSSATSTPSSSTRWSRARAIR